MTDPRLPGEDDAQGVPPTSDVPESPGESAASDVPATSGGPVSSGVPEAPGAPASTGASVVNVFRPSSTHPPTVSRATVSGRPPPE